MVKYAKPILSIFVLAALLSFAAAAHILSPASFNFNEKVSNNYTIRVNNTDIGPNSNITAVNISIPAGFTFTLGTNATSAALAVFSNTTNATGYTILHWSNASGMIMNATGNPNNITFSFNASANTTMIGTYTFIIRTLNATTMTQTTRSVTINDTSGPATVEFSDPTPVNHANISGTSIAVNASATDNVNVSTIRVLLFNSTGLVNSTNSTANSTYLNFTSLPEGTYTFNVTALDNVTNSNTSTTMSVILDTTAPTISIARSTSSTESVIAGTVTVSDGGSGVMGTCSVVGAAVSATNGSGTQSFTSTGQIDCGETVSFTATCSDFAGNSGSASASLRSNECNTAGGSSSGGGSSSNAWTMTYASDSKELSEIGTVSKSLSAKQRVRLLVNGKEHHVGVTSLTSDKVTVEISSSPQSAQMSIGETRKFDVDKDGFYDLSVTLNSVSNGKANLSIDSIHEAVPAEAAEDAGSSSQDAAAAEQDSGAADDASGRPSVWIWIIAAIVVAVAIIALLPKRKSRRK